MNKKHKKHENDIIVALATPYGKSALAVIRVSGPGSKILVGYFIVENRLKHGKMIYNKFMAGDFEEKLMTVCFDEGRSYTGEETVELYPHGNMEICNKIIAILIDAGARLAERGEFTKRAFLNGKLDLMQCEALADIIDAETSEQLHYGNDRFNGEFKSLAEIENRLEKALSTVEAVLHYGDELEDNEINDGILNDVYGSLDVMIKKLETEIEGYNGGRIINDGFKVALIGAPNVGKSTLLNALTDSERAIVTPVAGTTRDVLDGSYIFNGRKFTVIDTAGMTDTDDVVEKIGVERAKSAAETADAVILITVDDENEINSHYSGRIDFTVVNKCDKIKDVGKKYESAISKEKLKISAKNKINITALKQKLFELCPKSFGAICNHRQYECVEACLDACKAAKREAENANGFEIVSALLYEAYAAIKRLYGEQADESIINTVFERFCVGK